MSIKYIVCLQCEQVNLGGNFCDHCGHSFNFQGGEDEILPSALITTESLAHIPLVAGLQFKRIITTGANLQKLPRRQIINIVKLIPAT